MTLHLVALGANAGPSRAANARMVARGARVLSAMFRGRVRVSPLYATPAWPPSAGPEFVNAAARIDSPLHPEAMLARLHAIEARFGRVRHRRWAVRSLDLDLLASGSTVRPDDVAQTWWRTLPPERQARDAPDRLILPHPRLQDRAFVLLPLRDVAPGWRHPVTGRSVVSMAEALPMRARAGVRRLETEGNRLVKP